MKKYRTKDMSETIGTVGSMLLFLLFAGCMLMIISVAAGTYNRISNNFDKTFGTAASLRYVSNKIRASESARIINEGSGLVLKEGGAAVVIYCENGALYEKTVPADGDVSAQGGEKIFTLKDMEVSESGGLFKISAAFGDEKKFTFVKKR